MSILDTIKNVGKKIFQAEKNNLLKIKSDVVSFTKNPKESLKGFNISTPEKKEQLESMAFGAVGTAGAVGAKTARLLKTAVQKKVSTQGIKNILNIGEKNLKPLVKKTALDVSENLTNFLKSQGEYLQKEASERASKIFNTPITQQIVKIRKAGNGTIKIRRGELDVMKTMQDLRPSLGEYKLQNPIRVFEQLGDNAKELFYRPIKAAENVTINAKEFWNTEFKNLTKGLNNKSSEKIAKYAVSLEQDGQKLLQSMKKTVEPLEPNEKKVYDYMRTRYDKLLEELNQTRAVIGKEPIKKRANYFTHIEELNTIEQMGFSLVRDNIETLLSNMVHRNAPAFQFAKQRTGVLNKVELDAFNVFNKYQEKAIENINMSPAITKIRELSRTIIRDPETGEAFKLLEQKPKAYKYITQWLDHIAGQKIDTGLPKIVENNLMKLNNNIAFSTLSYNIRSAVIQPSAIINAVTEIGPKYTGVGIKGLMSGRGDFALKNSYVLKGRQFDTAIKDMATNFGGKANRLKQDVGNFGIKFLQVLDSFTAQATWLGAYDYAIAKLGKVGREAYNYADDVVIKTQASAARSDVAAIQRTPLGKVATLFQTFVINDFNRLIKDVAGVGTKMSNTDRIKKASRYIIGVSLWNYLSEDVLGIPSPFPRPIKALKEKGVGESLKEVAGQVPIIGGGFRYGSSPTGAIGDLVNATVSKISGKYTPQSWWEITGKLLGIPGVAQLKKSIKAINGLQDGYTVTTNNGKKIKIKITDSADKVRAVLFGLYDTKKASETRNNKSIKKSPLERYKEKNTK